MAYVKPSATELKFAYRLLTYLHANVNNTYLLLAIVAWARSESGRNWIGNNPLNIRNSQYASGYRQTKHNGHFALFKDVDAAAHASAEFLMQNHGNGYELIIAAARRNGGAKDYAQQAVDFLYALVLSKWDSGHYGLNEVQRQDINNLYHTTLYEVWTGLLGHKITLPTDVLPPVKPPPVVHHHTQPDSRLHGRTGGEYVQPYAAVEFYDQRVRGAEGPPGDPNSTGL